MVSNGRSFPRTFPVHRWILLLPFLSVCPSKRPMREVLSSFCGWGSSCWGLRVGLKCRRLSSHSAPPLYSQLLRSQGQSYSEVSETWNVLQRCVQKRSTEACLVPHRSVLDDDRLNPQLKRSSSLKGQDEVLIKIYFYIHVCACIHVHDCTCICIHVCTKARGAHRVSFAITLQLFYRDTVSPWVCLISMWLDFQCCACPHP